MSRAPDDDDDVYISIHYSVVFGINGISICGIHNSVIMSTWRGATAASN